MGTHLFLTVVKVSRGTQTDPVELAILGSPMPVPLYEKQGQVFRFFMESERIHFYKCSQAETTNCKARAYYIKSQARFITRTRHDHTIKEL